MWRYRMRSWSRDSIHLPEWSRRRKKCQGLWTAKGVDKEETQRELTNEGKSQWSHSPSLTPTPKKIRSRDYSHQRQSHAKPSSELASLRLSLWPHTKSLTLFSMLPLYSVYIFLSLTALCDARDHLSPLTAPSNIMSTLKTESYTCAPVFLSGTWWTHKNSYWNELG